MTKDTVSQPATPAPSTKKGQTQDRIARRAYELYEQGGRQEGRALEDWLKAERQLVGTTRQS
jgi:hypothetical protein